MITDENSVMVEDNRDSITGCKCDSCIECNCDPCVCRCCCHKDSDEVFKHQLDFE